MNTTAIKVAMLAALAVSVCLKLSAQVLRPLSSGQSPARSSSPQPTPPAVTIFKVDVNMVLVEVGVHDEHGRAVGSLTRDDFRVFENGKEQTIASFSHEELPLAVALVVDNSSSIMAALDQLRAGSLNTLALLQPDDRMAIFSFGEKPELEEGLTSNHQTLSVDLWALSPYGGTALNDALYEAALYLGREAPQRRRAVILVSDNEPSDEETRTVPQVVQAAQQSGTPIYSIKVGYLEHSRGFFQAHSQERLHDVEKICRQTGGELIDTRNGMSVSSAMETILTWLKQGYTIGYYPSNGTRDGTYRSIEVRLNQNTTKHGPKYTIYARPGYFAPSAAKPAGA